MLQLACDGPDDQNACHASNDAFLDYVPPGHYYDYLLPLVYVVASTVMAACGFWSIVGANTDPNGVVLAIVGFSLLGFGLVGALYTAAYLIGDESERNRVLYLWVFLVPTSAMIITILGGVALIYAQDGGEVVILTLTMMVCISNNVGDGMEGLRWLFWVIAAPFFFLVATAFGFGAELLLDVRMSGSVWKTSRRTLVVGQGHLDLLRVLHRFHPIAVPRKGPG